MAGGWGVCTWDVVPGWGTVIVARQTQPASFSCRYLPAACHARHACACCFAWAVWTAAWTSWRCWRHVILSTHYTAHTLHCPHMTLTTYARCRRWAVWTAACTSWRCCRPRRPAQWTTMRRVHGRAHFLRRRRRRQQWWMERAAALATREQEGAGWRPRLRRRPHRRHTLRTTTTSRTKCHFWPAALMCGWFCSGAAGHTGLPASQPH
mmetsp:Transcript_26340/g.78232  ORF Transcript_26340/g.78232 Transcript_26340/m.78232 type:complete len:208 (+) Transcript_26340:183-806(+)